MRPKLIIFLLIANAHCGNTRAVGLAPPTSSDAGLPPGTARADATSDLRPTDDAAPEGGLVVCDTLVEYDCDESTPCTDYVIDRLLLPLEEAALEATGWWHPDTGERHNLLGTLLAVATSGTGGTEIDPAGFAQRGVDRGDTLLLLTVQAILPYKSLTWLQARNARPTACCVGDGAALCRAQAEATCFTGSAAFAVDPASPEDAVVTGGFDDEWGGFGPMSSFPLRVAIGPDTVMILPLHEVKIWGRFVDGEIHDGAISGLVPGAEIDAAVVAPLAQLLDNIIARDAGSDTAQLIGQLFDIDGDRRISPAELKRSIVKDLLLPDVDLDGDGSDDHLSFGAGFTAVGATILP